MARYYVSKGKCGKPSWGMFEYGSKCPLTGAAAGILTFVRGRLNWVMGALDHVRSDLLFLHQARSYKALYR